MKLSVIFGVLLHVHLFSPAKCSQGSCMELAKGLRRCYYLVKEKADWFAAKLDCESRGQRLASIEDQPLMDFVEGSFPDRPTAVWIGLKRAGPRLPNVWSSGIPLNKTAYTLIPAVGTSGNEPCSRIKQPPGKLDDYVCTANFQSICESYQPPTFKLRHPGTLLSNTSPGQEVTSAEPMTLIQCARVCETTQGCVTISYKDSKCFIHTSSVDGEFVVTSEIVYQKVESYRM